MSSASASSSAAATSTWMMLASTDKSSYIAQTTISNSESGLLYRALSKWLIRGGAGKILDSFWEYIDKWDNELEDALLDQLLTQAEKTPEDPQITNVRTKDYSIDMTIHSKNTSNNFKTCQADFVLYVFFQSINKKIKIDEQSISITLIKADGKVEKVSVDNMQKTPAPSRTPNRRVNKRSSKEATTF